MAKTSRIICIFIIVIFLCGSFFINNNFILADDMPDHILINEIQIGGESANDEFIELYNPTDNAINLEDWDLKRKTKSGSEDNILNNIKGIISPQGYFLIIPRANCGENKDEACYTKEVAGDDEYTTNSFLAKNNTILLYNNNGDLIDKVGWGEWGEARDFEGEIISVNPENNENLERKSVDNIIQDTDNNNDDFILATNPNPQNSLETEDEEDTDDDENNSGDDEEQDDSSQDTGGNDDDDEEHTPNPSQEGNNGSDENNNDEEIPPAPFDKGGTNKIIITEFLPNPEDSDKDNEFIEIYNAGEANANLEGWTLEDKMGKIKTFEISKKVKIKPGGYKAFYSDQTRITLNNSGDGVILKSVNGDIIDETPVSDSAKEDQTYALNENGDWVWTLRPTAGRKNIIKEEEKANDIKQDDSSQETEVNEDETEANDNNDDERDDSAVLRDYGANDANDDTSDYKNIEYNFSDEIVISEIYPNPEGRDNRNGNYEWIELYNCSSQAVNLIGWQIDDILRKGSKPYIIKENKIISAKRHLVLTNEETKVIFNNSGDEVNLSWPDGTIVDSVQYGKSIEGQSRSWIDGDWVWSQIITPNKNNIANVPGKILGAESVINSDNEDEIEIDESDVDIEENLASDLEYIKVTVAEAKKLPRFSYVEISGIVSTPPGVFSDTVFYIAGSGIQVYGKSVDISGINMGDEIKIAGQISEVGEEKRILLNKAENIEVISHDNLVESKIVSIADIGEETGGYLVTVEGEVTRIENDVFFLGDGSGEIKIYIKPQTKIEKTKVELNNRMTITGQVSRTSAGYRILPRFQADLKFGRVSGAAATSTEQEGGLINNKKIEKNVLFSENANYIIYAIIMLAGALILIDWGRMKVIK